MIVPDTSAWVAYLRGLDDPVSSTLTDLVDQNATLATTETVVMEVLAGGRTDVEVRRTRQELLRFPLIPLRGLADYEEAAALFRTCRRGGDTIRSMIDCLIAVAAIRANAAVLHRDRDFDAIARHSPLKIHPVQA